jgi:predicted SnoaL-like aldol condensation-catalyzing enzyme
MKPLLQPAIGVARFFYNFVVGDDQVVAAVMLLALVATGLLVAVHVNAWWLVPALAITMTWLDLRRRRTS